MSAQKTGGEWVVEALRAEGVRHVFGIPGVHNLAIYDALFRQAARDPIAHVLARHEAGAAFMADGYARSSGRTGVVVVTTGPGATNVLTPLVESYAGSQPMVVNDDRFGAIKWLQERMFEGRWGEADLVNPDFVQLAHAFGARGVKVKGLDDLGDTIRAGLAADGPTLVELNLVLDPPWDV